MSRSTIYDKMQNGWNLHDTVNRIHKLLFDINTVAEDDFMHQEYTIISFIDSICFNRWKESHRFIDISDLLNVLHYEELRQNATLNFDSFLSYVELSYTLYQVANKFTETTSVYECYSLFFKIENILQDCLERLNHRAYYDEKNELVLVVEKNDAVTSTVEVENDPEIASEIIRYNHQSLRGDLVSKKSILLKLGNQIEACRDEISRINKQLSQDIFTLFNNLNIRHNNIALGHKKYQKTIAAMSPEELENWYDELYQMVLLAKLELDNVERTRKVAALKANFT